MPTFDFANICRILARGCVSLVCSPIVVISALAVGLTFALSGLLEYFVGFSLVLPEFEIYSFDSSTNFLDLFSFALDFHGFITLITSLISAEITITTLCFNFIVASFALYMLRAYYNNLRTYIKDLIG